MSPTAKPIYNKAHNIQECFILQISDCHWCARWRRSLVWSSPSGSWAESARAGRTKWRWSTSAWGREGVCSCRVSRSCPGSWSLLPSWQTFASARETDGQNVSGRQNDGTSWWIHTIIPGHHGIHFNIKPKFTNFKFPCHCTHILVSVHLHVHTFMLVKWFWDCVRCLGSSIKKPSPVRSSERRRPERRPGSDRRISEWCSAACCRSPETSPRISQTSETCTRGGGDGRTLQ